ncbi:MAG TPA: sigma-54 dependent transcriptional regulator [Ramlibacter sp.]|nr:sigma-54 dependent transcriptional regulator [Ramlibacter sp.]
MAQLLVIEDEFVLAKNIARFFERQGHSVSLAHDGQTGLELAEQLAPDVVIVDFQLPGLNGLEVIRDLRRSDEQVRIVMITGHGSINLAVEAMKAGSMDLLTKPLSLTALDQVVQRALKERSEKTVLEYLKARDNRHASVEALLGRSPAMQALRQLIRTIAESEPSDGSLVSPVLVQGETGTGKELVARACHLAGPRHDRPFIEVNCAALPSHLMEDELFGHEKGAFTDARTRKVGLIEAADGGTLFLDEIGEMELSLQAKLLRVLENLKVRPIGAVADRRVNVRVVAATNRDLAREAQEKRFRSDLLYRLSVFQIRITPLRERGDDVVQLAEHFLEQLASRYVRSKLLLDDGARAALTGYSWPGNVRELRNILERLVLIHGKSPVTADDLRLPADFDSTQSQDAQPVAAVSRAPGPAVPLETVERQHLSQALEAHHWNVSLAARALGVTRDTLRYRMVKHGLQRDDDSGSA